MHDPLTQAFSFGNWLTIWHRDPMNFKDKTNCRSDDSCGWFTPPYSPAQRDTIEKLAEQQYREIFSHQVATREGKSYAYVCNKPDCQAAIYWSWRAIKHKFKPRGVWKYGSKLIASEREHIYSLATNPVDNLQLKFSGVNDQESFKEFFFCVFNAYLRHHRPWYRHPKWHVWHWELQFRPLQQFKRWAFSRCAGCGKGFRWGYAPTTASWHGDGPKWLHSEPGVYHSGCFPHPQMWSPGPN